MDGEEPSQSAEATSTHRLEPRPMLLRQQRAWLRGGGVSEAYPKPTRHRGVLKSTPCPPLCPPRSLPRSGPSECEAHGRKKEEKRVIAASSAPWSSIECQPHVHTLIPISTPPGWSRNFAYPASSHGPHLVPRTALPTRRDGGCEVEASLLPPHSLSSVASGPLLPRNPSPN